MGKSVRSKQQRINRSNRRNFIHKPVEEERLKRLLEKGKVENLKPLTVVDSDPVTDGIDVDESDLKPVILTAKEKKELMLNRNQKKKKLNARKTKTLKISKKLKKFE